MILKKYEITAEEYMLIRKKLKIISSLTSNDERKNFINPSRLIKNFELLIGHLENCNKTFKITVDYSISIDELVKKIKIHKIDDKITSKNFPNYQTKKIEIEFQIVYFGVKKTTAEIIEEMKKNKLRPANIKETLFFILNYPKIQLNSSIVALKSSYTDSNGYEYYPFLFENNLNKLIILNNCIDNWESSYNFLAVNT